MSKRIAPYALCENLVLSLVLRKRQLRVLFYCNGQRTHEYLGYALNVLLARIHGCAPVGCRTPVCTFFPLKHKSVSIFPKAVAAAFR